MTLNKEMLQGHFTKIITTRCQSVMYISFCCSYVFVAAASRKYKTTQGRLQPLNPLGWYAYMPLNSNKIQRET